ncbi:ParB/RepB/Spo0J family partition protein [Gordonia sp. CPCC 205515]|uniref:ParB/RepB/Spo0J family partition protein n=1 Tax=Gordonia sp. CPCC 205515 TaxID=3140791 RepID=UPI003AF3C1E5
MADNTTTATIPTGELRTLDPHELVIGDNIRTDAEAKLTADFVASVKDGLLSPILATDTGDAVVVRDGQMRTLAARQAGLTTVPVYVLPATADESDTEQLRARVIDQYKANEHRTDLTASERVEAIAQLSLHGVSPTRIAKSLGLNKKKEVDPAIAAAKSQHAKDALDADTLTLEQAAVLAQYDDEPEAQDELMESLRWGRFEHTAAHLAATTAERAAAKAQAEQYTADGIAATLRHPSHADTAERLSVLVDANGARVTDIEQVPHEQRLAYVHASTTETWTDTDGNEVDEDLIDWSLEDEEDPEATPDDGLRDPRTLTRHEHVEVETTWCVADPAALGWSRYSFIPTGNTSDEQVPQDTQAKSDERRQVIALNKLALTATEVRRQKVTEYLSRKTLPKGKAGAVAAFLAETMWQYHDLLGYNRADGSARALATAFLGDTAPLAALDGASAERRQIINLAIALGAHEADMPKTAWRETDRSYTSHRPVYLRLLVDVFGYTLSEIEEVIAADKQAADIDLT